MYIRSKLYEYLPPNFIGGGKTFKPADGVINVGCKSIKNSIQLEIKLKFR